VHGINPRAWIKELRQRLGETHDRTEHQAES
jgi:hypothetical protein